MTDAKILSWNKWKKPNPRRKRFTIAGCKDIRIRIFEFESSDQISEIYGLGPLPVEGRTGCREYVMDLKFSLFLVPRWVFFRFPGGSQQLSRGTSPPQKKTLHYLLPSIVTRFQNIYLFIFIYPRFVPEKSISAVFVLNTNISSYKV